MNKCKCGCTTFLIDEAILHKAEIDDGGILIAYKTYGNLITSIKCMNCDKEYGVDKFKEVQFG